MHSKQKMARIHHMLRRLRIQNKQHENVGKPALDSEDVLNTTDFIFFKARSKPEGDSGTLFLAKRKTNPDERYLIKHEFADCAVDEYVYAKLCNAMNIRTPQVKLFNIPPEEKRHHFKTEYVMGAVYYDIVSDNPSLAEMRQAPNWHDYFRCRALEGMFNESDGIEFILAKDSYLYRVDTTDAFPLSPHVLSLAGVDIDFDGAGITAKETIRQQLLNDDFEQHWHSDTLCEGYQSLCARYGADAQHFLDPFTQIQTIPSTYIDDFLTTLCYFYPDFIGEYFKNYITAIQKFSKDFLQNLKDMGTHTKARAK
jgi:hypothetical protein